MRLDREHHVYILSCFGGLTQSFYVLFKGLDDPIRVHFRRDSFVMAPLRGLGVFMHLMDPPGRVLLIRSSLVVVHHISPELE